MIALSRLANNVNTSTPFHRLARAHELVDTDLTAAAPVTQQTDEALCLELAEPSSVTRLYTLFPGRANTFPRPKPQVARHFPRLLQASLISEV